MNVSRTGLPVGRDYMRDLLATGTREDIIAYLCQMDPNGCYDDKQCELEIGGPLTDEEVQDCLQNHIDELHCGMRMCADPISECRCFA